MGNKHRGEVSFDIDGKTWTLALGINALCELEAEFDKPVNAIFAEMDDGKVSVRTLRSVFRAGLARHHSKISQAEAGDLMEAVGLAETARLIGDAVKAALPGAAPGEEKAEA
jgi:hypothetical protein